MNFSGVHIASITPFDVDKQIDHKALTALLEFFAEQGVNGLVPCGTTGEAPTLTDGEWASVVKTAVSVAKAKKLVTIAGCGSNSTAKACSYVAQAKEMGADAALVVTPYYNKPTPAGLTKHFHAVAEIGLPIILYNVPSRTQINLSVELTRELLKHPSIVGIKEATSDMSKWMRLTTEIDWTQKTLLSGEDGILASVLGAGAHGVISAAGNVIPAEFVKIYKNAVAGNWPGAHAEQARITPLVDAMFMESNPGPAKYALSLMGRCQNIFRLPLDPVTAPTAAVISTLLKKSGHMS